MLLQVPPYILNLTPYVPGKPIHETQREFQLKKVIKLASNENPLGPSPKAQKAVQRAISELHRYPDSNGFDLKEELTCKLGVSPRQVILGNGSNEIIDQLIRTYCLVDDFIITPQAAFIAYKICAQIHGVKTIEIPINSDMKFDLEQMLSAIRKNKKIKMVFIANPNNPTGAYLNTSEVEVLLQGISKMRNRSILIVLDYAYWEYITAHDFPNPMELLNVFPNLIILKTFSKIYELAGLRIGYAIASPEIIGHLEKVRQPFNINSLALVGAKAALKDDLFVKKSRALNCKGMLFWEKGLSSLGIPFWRSQGNFLLADVKKGLGKTGVEMFQECLQEGIILRPLANYGLPHAIRISIGNSIENKLALQVLRTKKGNGEKTI